MGDDDSVRGLYERFAPQVYRRARRLLGRDADAWDAVQEVFEKVLSARSKFRGDAQPMTFLYRVTTNVSLNLLRSRALREGQTGVPVLVATMGEGVEAAQLLRRLGAGLTPRALEVAALHFVDGLRQEEVAQVLDVSRKTVVRELAAIREHAATLGGLPGLEVERA